MKRPSLENEPFSISVTADVPSARKLTIHRAALRVLSGALAGSDHEITDTPLLIGRDEDCDLILNDPGVSTRHAEIGLRPEGYLLTDLDSHNGLWAGGWRAREIFLAPEMIITVGGVALQVVDLKESVEVGLGPVGPVGRVIGRSLAMRRVFWVLEAAARSSSPVLIEGESGTGKELLAEALHEQSFGERGPFEIFDCGAVAPTLLESELFGHEAGAFTGAVTRHIGAVERASGGTLFLDEIGELSLELQVKLLRAVERGEFRRVGGNKPLRSTARIVAATNRNLNQLVKQGQFRSDLFFRLSVLRIAVPPLRERAEDIPLLIEHFLTSFGASPERMATLPDLARTLGSYRWPGNVRELRNVVERLELLPLPEALPSALQKGKAQEPRLAFSIARELAMERFEQAYLKELLRSCNGNVTRAAELAQVSRRYVTMMMSKYGIKRDAFVH